MRAKYEGLVAAVFVSAIVLSACTESGQQRVKPCTGAGRWFPKDRASLTAMIDGFFEAAKTPTLEGTAVAVIAPHAGYTYSGKAAGAGYAPLRGMKFDRVIVMGPSHRFQYPGAALSSMDAFATPLGNVPVDRAVCEALEKETAFSFIDDVLLREHSVENQIPFLQRALGEFKIVPIVIGYGSDADFTRMAQAIAKHVNNKTLLVASTDFTHYGATYGYVPFSENVKENLYKLDHGAIDFIVSRDANGFSAYVAKTKATICGRNAVNILLRALPMDARGTLLSYYTSGDLNNDYSLSVGYAGIVFTQGHKEGWKMSEDKEELVGPAGQKKLLQIAREAVAAAVTGATQKDVKVDDAELQIRAGCFVTLTNKGRLRGCLGNFTSGIPLYRLVQRMAAASATQDFRFAHDRITPEELPEVHVEISVLSPMRRIQDPMKEVVLGKHGIYIKRGGRSGTYLPQVATEFHMTKEKFLSSCCSSKAGLPADAWKEKDTEVYVYTAQVFHEERE